MTCRIICPHCRCAIDPLSLETALSAHAEYRICPECDAAIVVSLPLVEAGQASATSAGDALLVVGAGPPASLPGAPCREAVVVFAEQGRSAS